MIDWLSSMIAGLIAAESDEAIMSQAVLNLSLAVAHRLNGHNITSIEHAERASILARKADWPKGEAVAHSVVASVRWQSGELRMAVTELNNCLAVYREIGEIAGQTINLSNLGVLYGELGDLPQAIDAATKAMAPLTPEDAVTAAKFRGALGNYLFQSGQFVEAEGHLQEALLLAEQVGDRGNTADILTYLADVSLHFGRYTNAVALAERATAIYEETGYVRGLATGSDIIGRIQHRLGRYDESIAHHERARQIAIKHSFQYPHVQALLGLAEAHTRLRNHDIARGHAMLARDMAANAGFRLLEKKAKTILAV